MVMVLDSALSIALVVMAGGAAANGRWLRRHTRAPRAILAAALLGASVVVPCAVACALWPAVADHMWASIVVQIVGWSLLGVILLVVRANRLERITEALPPLCVLAVGAHPDDLELGCGATLARWVDAGYTVHGVVMSRGERGGNAGVRPAEAHSAAGFIGAQSVTVLDFPDTHLSTRPADLVLAIEEVITRVHPDLILTHSANDTHQDHQAVHAATLRAARHHTSLLCYESPSATTGFRPTVFVDITDYLDVKVDAVATHRDQGGKPYMTRERIRATAAYRGGQAKVRHAEAYEPVRMLATSAVSPA